LADYTFMFYNCQSRTGICSLDEMAIDKTALVQYPIDMGKITSYFHPVMPSSDPLKIRTSLLTEVKKGSPKQVEGVYSLATAYSPHLICLAESQQHTVSKIYESLSKAYRCTSQLGSTSDKPMTVFVRNDIFQSTKTEFLKVPGMSRLMPTFLVGNQVLVSFVHTVHTASNPGIETIAALKTNLTVSNDKCAGMCGLVCGDFNVDISEEDTIEALKYAVQPDWNLIVPTDEQGAKTVSRPASNALLDFGAVRPGRSLKIDSQGVLSGKKYGSDHKPLIIKTVIS